ncbi:winged helix-turn-helix domain-containing protein [Nonomuraea sp. B19D2]|uniref:winged helix-turn-helix domain-containing protein n=1 Tax=Nonomuraea sp. B19D2 TaxID=3159561 RepID=UPI0032DB8844
MTSGFRGYQVLAGRGLADGRGFGDGQAACEVSRGGEPVELSPHEFALLRLLMRTPDRVLTAAQILDGVWSYDFGSRASVGRGGGA